MKRVARKRIVFVIVEGPSEEDALGILLNKIYDKNLVYLHITHGDITIADDTDSNNIISKISDVIKSYAESNHLTSDHFQEIVHIIDTDGAFIPKEAVVYNKEAKKPIYELKTIQTNNVEKIQKRNERKSRCLVRIAQEDHIWNIPYQAYYMSSNLDHVLYDKQNSSDEEKEADSLAFARKYRDDIDGFINYICDSPFSVPMNYRESWKYIQEETRSLERHTNFGICLTKAIGNTEAEKDESSTDSN